MEMRACKPEVPLTYDLTPEPTQETWTVKDDDIWVFGPTASENAKFADPDNLHEELDARAVALVDGEAHLSRLGTPAVQR